MNSNLRTRRSAALGFLALSMGWCLQPSQAATITPIETAHNCQCLAKGHRYSQGEIACIGGRRLQCAMSQNVSSWAPLPGQCDPSEVSGLPHLHPWFAQVAGVMLACTKPASFTPRGHFTPM